MSYKNTYASVLTATKTAYPLPVTKAGTISCAHLSLIVTGYGTNFQQDIIPGDFIYNKAATNGEVRKVTSVSQDYEITGIDATGNSTKVYQQLLTIDSAFSTVSLHGADFDVIKTDIRKFSISNNHASADIIIDGVNLAAGDTINVDREGPNGVADSFIDPVVVNTDGGTAVVLVIK